MKLRKMNRENFAVKWKKGVSKDYSRLKKRNISPTNSSLSKEKKTELEKVSSLTVKRKKDSSSQDFAKSNCLPVLHNRPDLYLLPSSSKRSQDYRPMPHLVKENDSKTSGSLKSRNNKRKLSKDSLKDKDAAPLPSSKKSRASKTSKKGIIHGSDAPSLFAEPHLLDLDFKVVNEGKLVDVPRNCSKSMLSLPSSYYLRNKHKDYSNPKTQEDNLCMDNNSVKNGVELDYPNLEKISSDLHPNEEKFVKCKRCTKPMSYLCKTQFCSFCKAKVRKERKDALTKTPPKSKRHNTKSNSVESSKNLDALMSSKPNKGFNGVDLKKQRELSLKPSELVQGSKKKTEDPITSIDISKNNNITILQNGSINLGPSITITKCSSLPKKARKCKKEATLPTSTKLCPFESNKPAEKLSSDKNSEGVFYSTAAMPNISALGKNSSISFPSISITLVDVKTPQSPVVKEVKNTDISIMRIEKPKESSNNKAKKVKFPNNFKCQNSAISKAVEKRCNSPSSKESKNSEEVKEKLNKVINCNNSNKSKKNLINSVHKEKVSQRSSPKCFENSKEAAVQSLSSSIVNILEVSGGTNPKGDNSSNNDCPEIQKTSRKRKIQVFKLPVAKTNKTNIQLEPVNDKTITSPISEPLVESSDNQMVTDFSMENTDNTVSDSKETNIISCNLIEEKQIDDFTATEIKEKTSEVLTLQIGNSDNKDELEDSHPCYFDKDQVIASPRKGEEKEKTDSPSKSPKEKSNEPKLYNTLSSEFETQEKVSKLFTLENQSKGVHEKSSSETIESNFKHSQEDSPSMSPSRDNATLKELLSSVPKNGIIVRKSANSDSEFLCIKCCQKLRSPTECCWHYSNCNFQFGEGQSVLLKDISWICNLCRSNFLTKETLGNHECHVVDTHVRVPPHINRCNPSIPIQTTLVIDTQAAAQEICSTPENHDSLLQDPVMVEATQGEALEFSESVLDTDVGDDQVESMFRPQISSVFTMLEDQKADLEEELDNKEDKKPDLKPLQMKMEAELGSSDAEASDEESFNIFSELPLAFDAVSQQIPRICLKCHQPFIFSPNDLDRKLNVRILNKSRIYFKFLAICKNCDLKHYSTFSLPVDSIEDSFKKVYIDYMKRTDKDADTTRYFFELCKLFSSKNGNICYPELDFLNSAPKEVSPGMEMSAYLPAFRTEGPSVAQSLDPNISWNSVQETPLQGSVRLNGSFELPEWPVDSTLHREPMNLPGTFSLFQSRSGEALGPINLKIYDKDSSNPFDPGHSIFSGTSTQCSFHESASGLKVQSQKPSNQGEPMNRPCSNGPQISSCQSVADCSAAPGTSSTVQGLNDSNLNPDVSASLERDNSPYSASLVSSISKNVKIQYIRNFDKPDTYKIDSTHYCSECFLGIPEDKISEHYYFKHDSSLLKTEINVLNFLSC